MAPAVRDTLCRIFGDAGLLRTDDDTAAEGAAAEGHGGFVFDDNGGAAPREGALADTDNAPTGGDNGRVAHALQRAALHRHACAPVGRYADVAIVAAALSSAQSGMGTEKSSRTCG